MASKLGDKLKTYRTKKGLTLDALAAAAGMSKSYLWELENRESLHPSAEKLQAVAAVLGVDMAFFVDDSVKQPKQEHLDDAFFRDYNKLDASAKEQLHQILETFKKK